MTATDDALARDLQTPVEMLMSIAQRSSDLTVLALIAAHPNASAQLLAELWSHPRVSAVRAQDPSPRDFAGYDVSDEEALYQLETTIASHPNIPDNLLARLHTDWRYNLPIASNPRTAAQMLDSIARRPDSGLAVKAIVHHANTSTNTLEYLACVLGDEHLDALQAHPNSSALVQNIIAYRLEGEQLFPQAAERMADHGNIHMLIADPTTPTPILDRIFNRLKLNLVPLTQMANHPNISPATLQAMSERLVMWYQGLQASRTFASNPTVSDSVLTLYTTLMSHADQIPGIQSTFDRLGAALWLFQIGHHEKLRLASNGKTSPEQLALLAQDVSEHVLEAVARNPAAPLLILEQLALYHSQMIEDTLARHTQASPDLLRELYQRQSVRYLGDRRYWLFAAHPNTPQEILTTLSRHKDVRIQEALNSNPNFRRT